MFPLAMSKVNGFAGKNINNFFPFEKRGNYRTWKLFELDQVLYIDVFGVSFGFISIISVGYFYMYA